MRQPFGGHVSHLLESTNEHLRRTLANPDVLARGCTRLEISIYGCKEEDLSERLAEDLLEDALSFPCEDADCAAEGHEACADRGLFVAQPVARQWQNHARHLDRCFLLADRPNGLLYVARSGHSETGRVQGMLVKPPPATTQDPAKWVCAIEWAMADFGLRRCPIFCSEILGAAGEEVAFSPIRCFVKDAPTILAAYNRHCELHIGAPDPSTVLPPTEHVEWVWRTPKTHRIGTEIAAGRRLATLSTRGRLRRQQELLDGLARVDWEERMRPVAARHQALWEARAQELARLREAVEEKRRCIEGRQRQKQETEKVLSLPFQKLAAVADEGLEAVCLGFCTVRTGRGVTLQEAVDCGGRFAVWETKGLERILDRMAGVFAEGRTSTGNRPMAWNPSTQHPLRIRVAPTRQFVRYDGKDVRWNPLEVLETPVHMETDLLNRQLADLEEARQAAQAEERKQVPQRPSRCVAPPASKCTRALHRNPGDHLVTRFGETLYRNKARAILFLVPMVDGVLGEEETPVFGNFLQAEVERFGRPLDALEGPLYCRLGREKTTATNRKCRFAHLWSAPPALQPEAPQAAQQEPPEARPEVRPEARLAAPQEAQPQMPQEAPPEAPQQIQPEAPAIAR